MTTLPEGYQRYLQDSVGQVSAATGVDAESVRKVLDELGLTKTVDSLNRVFGPAAQEAVGQGKLEACVRVAAGMIPC